MECSKEGFCTNKNEDLKKECSYRKKLEQGINFYYKDRYSKSFIEIQGRLFSIGERSSYGGYTRSLSKSALDELNSKINIRGVALVSQVNFKKIQVEKVSEENRAHCKVILTIDGIKYNIQNFNSRALTHDTAKGIRELFVENGYLCAIEQFGTSGYGHKRNNKITTSNKSTTKDSVKKEIKPIKMKDKQMKKEEKQPQTNVQLSMFDLKVI
jgi:hypothetical protein